MHQSIFSLYTSPVTALAWQSTDRDLGSDEVFSRLESKFVAPM